MKKLFTFRWKLGRDTAFALCLGLAVIGASVLLLLFKDLSAIEHEIGFFILRDIVQIVVLGIVVPLWYILFIKKESLAEYGINARNWKRNLSINIVLTIGLFLIFSHESGAGIQMDQVFTDPKVIGPLIWLLFMGGVFEIFFFYAFMRTVLEKAFGIIPSILITAGMYSFHHAGFQPEFVKLIFVGILMASIFRLGGGFLVIFPFFWWLGASWDVLIRSQEAAQNLYVLIWPRIILDAMILGAVFIFFLWKQGRLRKT